MAVGALIAGLCGLCTGALEIGFLLQAIRYGEVTPMVLPLLFGGVPTLVGVGLFMWGRSLLDGKRAE